MGRKKTIKDRKFGVWGAKNFWKYAKDKQVALHFLQPLFLPPPPLPPSKTLKIMYNRPMEMGIVILVGAAMLGAAMGSFACCQAWRMRLKQEGKKNPGKRSVCLSCRRKLTWRENIPLISWTVQRGKCRRCGAKIGAAEIVSELTAAIVFALIAYYYIWQYGETGMPLMEIAKVAMVFITMIGMMILAVYDAKWGEMPTKVLTFVNACAIMYVILRFVGLYLDGLSAEIVPGLINGGIGVVLMAGTYLVLSKVGEGKLVGDGDWLLCLAIALILGHWWLALVAMCVANILALLAGLPGVIKRKEKNAKIYFSPYLVVAFVVTFVIQPGLLELAKGLSF